MSRKPSPHPDEDDTAVAALRQVASRRTVRSIKETLLAAILIRTACGRNSARHNRIAIPATAVIMASSIHWHVWQYALHLIH
jgi:hypothetical protein